MLSRTKALLVVALAALTMTVSVSAASAETANFSSVVGYPATVTPKGAFFMPGGGICISELSGTLAGKAESISVSPTLTKCETPTWAFEGCSYTFVAGNLLIFASQGSMDIVCPPEKQIKITSGACVKNIPPTENLGPVNYTNRENSTDDWVTIKFEVTVKYSQNSSCLGGEGTFEGTLKGTYEMVSSNHAVWVTE